MKPLFYRLYRAVRRVIPEYIPETQAVAFNMFLAFFPMLLVVLGVIASSAALRSAFQGMLANFKSMLPPGITVLLNGFLSRYNAHSFRWATVGLSGTLLAGTHMMRILMEGFRMVHGDTKRQSLVSIHLRALLLVIVTIAPSMLTVNLIVFGKQVRAWMLHNTSSLSVLIRSMWVILYVGTALAIGILVMFIIFRVGRPGRRPWSAVFPGAVVATLIWWAVSAALGFYLRHVPYSLIYGGLADTIGLMLWMQLTATALFIGAAYNAELQEASPTDFVLPLEYTKTKGIDRGRQR